MGSQVVHLDILGVSNNHFETLGVRRAKKFVNQRMPKVYQKMKKYEEALESVKKYEKVWESVRKCEKMSEKV